MQPLKVRRNGETELRIDWDDSHESRFTLRALRDNCPCASCKHENESGGGAVLLPILTPGQYELKGIELVGSYALQLTWGDGHRTGIYSYELLRRICECEICKNMRA